MKTNQADCTILPDPAAVPPIERSNAGVEEKSAVVKESEKVDVSVNSLSMLASKSNHKFVSMSNNNKIIKKLLTV